MIKENVVDELLRVGALIDAWEESACADCGVCPECERVNENKAEINFIEWFFENIGEGDCSQAFYRRAEELEEMPAEEFDGVVERAEALIEEFEGRW